jgi:hypothetical protein
MSDFIDVDITFIIYACVQVTLTITYQSYNSSLNEKEIQQLLKSHILEFCEQNFYKKNTPSANTCVKVINDHYFETQPIEGINIQKIDRVGGISGPVSYKPPYKSIDNVRSHLGSQKMSDDIIRYLTTYSPNM